MYASQEHQLISKFLSIFGIFISQKKLAAMEPFHADLCGYLHVGRLQFIRSIPSAVVSGSSLRFEVSCCSEFNESFSTIIPSLDITLYTTDSSDSSIRTINYSNAFKSFKTKQVGRNVCISFVAPETSGPYIIHVKVDSSDLRRLYIMELYSEVFQVYSRGKSVDLVKSMTLLGCYRVFPCPRFGLSSGSGLSSSQSSRGNLYIREEYGASLGSHLYDSSVIMMRYLSSLGHIPGVITTCRKFESVYSTENSNNKAGLNEIDPQTVVELGAGCGLLGIWLSELLAAYPIDIVMTDKSVQLPLMNHNLKLNSHFPHVNPTNGEEIKKCSSCTCQELNWESGAQVNALRAQIRNRNLGLILAADVFYDLSAASSLLNVIESLAIPGTTQILMAQKLRGGTAWGEDATEIPKLLRLSKFPLSDMCVGRFTDISCVHCEANVLIWSLRI